MLGESKFIPWPNSCDQSALGFRPIHVKDGGTMGLRHGTTAKLVAVNDTNYTSSGPNISPLLARVESMDGI